MKVAILGDLHFGVRNDSHIFLNYQRKFFENVFFPTLEERGIDTHIQMGDILDKRQTVNFHTFNQVKEMYLDECERRDIKGYMMIGNHDIYYRQTTEVNCWDEVFRERYGHFFHGVTKPETIEIGGKKCDFIPWICDSNEKEIFDFMKKSDSDYLFGHLELSGFPMMRGVLSDHGYDKNVFSDYKQVFSGHYHTQSERGNVMFMGTPYELTWADCGDPKIFLIWDTDTNEIEKVQNPYRLFHKIIYDDSETDYSKFDVDPYRHAYIRVIVQHKEDEKKFERFMTRLYKKAEPVDVQITDVTVSYRDVDIENVETQDPLTVMIQAIEDTVDGELQGRVRRDAMNLYSEALTEAKHS